ncbi:MAG: TraR/DksA family transcriptional regulator [Candidatus Aminicenantes bacterium]|nr:TraR/DksA family transcriptional regulator [Candidatus Aminicenantes bacterium]
MKTRDLERLKKKLLKKREEILSKLENLAKETSEEGEPLIEIYDKASYQFNKEYKIALGEKDAEVLKDIEDALRKIEEGTYGKCEECGADIPLKRLNAVPWTRYCVVCAERLEEEREAEQSEEEYY